MNLRFWHTTLGLFLDTKERLDCVACGSPVLLSHGEIRYRCPACGADLVLRRRYDWLYAAICVVGGLTVARLQRLDNPLFIMWALIYSAALLVIAAPILAPFFPIKLERAPDNHIQTLQIGKK
jgi:hypothetical protein